MGLCTTIRGLKDKEVVNLCDGARLGYVVDAEIDIFCAKILALVVLLDDGKFFSFAACDEIIIPWDRIEKFGDDVILVKVTLGECRTCEKNKCKKDRLHKFF